MITLEKAKEMFYYSDGKLYRKTSPHPRIKVGSEVGYKDTHGHLRLEIDNKTYAVHRIIFLLEKGYLPKVVDHINNIRDDNRIENLREATHSQNCMNVKRAKNNTSGFKNVNWHKENKKWTVNITVDKNQKYLGSFEDLELACLVAEEARNKYHKEFAQHE